MIGELWYPEWIAGNAALTHTFQPGGGHAGRPAGNGDPETRD